MSKWFWLGIGLAIGAAAMVAVLTLQPYHLRGSEIDPPVPAPEIILSSTQGGAYALSEQMGKLVLIFFGYTSCPDVCPVTLSEMRLLRSRLGDRAKDIDFVYITVDPARDTLEHMTRYLNAFDPAIIGLTGTEEELAPVWAPYGVYREIQEGASAAGYLVDHSSRLYLIDRSNRLRATYTYGTPVDEVEADLRHLLKERVQ
jgi:protein SCO1